MCVVCSVYVVYECAVYVCVVNVSVCVRVCVCGQYCVVYVRDKHIFIEVGVT